MIDTTAPSGSRATSITSSSSSGDSESTGLTEAPDGALTDTDPKARGRPSKQEHAERLARLQQDVTAAMSAAAARLSPWDLPGLLRAPLEGEPKAYGGVELRQYQQLTISAVVGAWKEGQLQQLVSMPTGELVHGWQTPGMLANPRSLGWCTMASEVCRVSDLRAGRGARLKAACCAGCHVCGEGPRRQHLMPYIVTLSLESLPPGVPRLNAIRCRIHALFSLMFIRTTWHLPIRMLALIS